jgi:hypothetical protein
MSSISTQSRSRMEFLHARGSLFLFISKLAPELKSCKNLKCISLEIFGGTSILCAT